jgi:TATA-box binding protein (TBP) (component of TFIID and TFIIIB)
MESAAAAAAASAAAAPTPAPVQHVPAPAPYTAFLAALAKPPPDLSAISTVLGRGQLETVVAQCDFRPALKKTIITRDKVWTEKAALLFATATMPAHGGAPVTLNLLAHSEFNPVVHPARALYFPRMRAEALVFPSGRVVVVGSRRGEAEMMALLSKCIRLVGLVSPYAIDVSKPSVSHVDVSWGEVPRLARALHHDLLWLDKLGLRFPGLAVEYAPSLLPAAVVSMRTCAATVTVFESGKVLVSARNGSEAATALSRFVRVYVEGEFGSEEALVEEEEERSAAAAAAAGGGRRGGEEEGGEGEEADEDEVDEEDEGGFEGADEDDGEGAAGDEDDEDPAVRRRRRREAEFARAAAAAGDDDDTAEPAGGKPASSGGGSRGGKRAGAPLPTHERRVAFKGLQQP